jgi:hypothetical protein
MGHGVLTTLLPLYRGQFDVDPREVNPFGSISSPLSIKGSLIRSIEAPLESDTVRICHARPIAGIVIVAKRFFRLLLLLLLLLLHVLTRRISIGSIESKKWRLSCARPSSLGSF